MVIGVFFLFSLSLFYTCLRDKSKFAHIANLLEVLFALQVCPHYKHFPDQSTIKGPVASNTGPIPPLSAQPANLHGNRIIPSLPFQVAMTVKRVSFE